MALRFRRSIKLAPGIRWNVSGGGSSFSFGPRGASITTGKRGTYLNTGIPGTGLSSRSRLSAPAVTPKPTAGKVSVQITCRVGDDGALQFFDSAGYRRPTSG
jgi:hypothetical protein